MCDSRDNSAGRERRYCVTRSELIAALARIEDRHSNDQHEQFIDALLESLLHNGQPYVAMTNEQFDDFTAKHNVRWKGQQDNVRWKGQ